MIPFFSVAADLGTRGRINTNGYSVGDVIFIPSLEGKRVNLPNGQSVIHPGYVMVEDKGSAIKGINRFDFFTGSYGQFDRDNAFAAGAKNFGLTSFGDKKSCDKEFKVIRRGAPGWDQALSSIASALNRDTNQFKTRFGVAREVKEDLNDQKYFFKSAGDWSDSSGRPHIAVRHRARDNPREYEFGCTPKFAGHRAPLNSA